MLKKVGFLSLLLTIGAFGLVAFAQEPGAEEMQAWMTFMTPGEEHATMAKGAGKWKTSSTFWMAPDAPPQTSEGKCVAEMILGGRYLQQTYTGDMGGMPFTGISIQAYDNAKKKYFSTWIDNMGTGIAWSEGTYDASKKAYVSNGTMTDPMTKKDSKFRMVTTFEGDDKFVMEMFMLADGKEYKAFSMTHEREG